MAKHRIHRDAVCPFYLHEDSQVIYCQGIQFGSVTHLAFANKTDALSYKKTHCRSNTGCTACAIHDMIGGLQDGR